MEFRRSNAPGNYSRYSWRLTGRLTDGCCVPHHHKPLLLNVHCACTYRRIATQPSQTRCYSANTPTAPHTTPPRRDLPQYLYHECAEIKRH
ncbi:hypothetical protein E2C01_036118 [Portunus trituberculatus]|uniref:Uncharacterized protein n=1 Tax=Portunus trituberculatus TaxID=210409 RepID=A0A5B7FB06_PORTR|nr:hypothetical protein [Portunus trituberculatus]